MKKPQLNISEEAMLTIMVILIYVAAIFGVQYFKEKDSKTTTVTYANIIQETEPIVLLDKPEEIIIPIEEPIIQEDPNEIINTYVSEICQLYDIETELIMSVIYHESRYNPNATNGQCLGLMQVSTRWHRDRAVKLGVNDFYDPHGNILLGVDYLSELFDKYKDPRLVLMLYNMNSETALKLYREGRISKYAKSVLAMADELKKGE